MANVGTATLNVVPKFPGLSAAVKSELSKIDASGIGKKSGEGYGSGFGGGLVKSGAVVGAFAAITNKAMSAISSSMDGAIRRFDTLNNYPQVMESLGYGAEAAESSISKMVGRLDNLPTTLDQMVSLTQGLVKSTNDLDKATEAALGLNDMLVASGASQQLVNSAQEQFRQILSKGKPEMQDWKSLVMAMPGQMDQLAKSMLGPTANANDLYAALGGGKNEQIISMDQLIDEIIRLDKEGGEGFASFQEQAETAAGGVQTSTANARNAVVKGITGVMDEIGKEDIAGFFNDMKAGINSAFAVVRSAVPAVKPVIKSLIEIVKQIGPTAIASIAGFAGFSKVAGIFGGFIGNARAASQATSVMVAAARLLGTSMNPVALGLGLAGTAAGAFALYCADASKKQENFKASTVGLSDAVRRTAELDSYRGKIDDIGQSSTFTAKSISELAESGASHVQKMTETVQKAEDEMGVLSSAQSIISQYASQTDITTEAQGKLEWALRQVNEQFGLSITAADVAAGRYTDQDGNVQDLTESIDKLVEAKKREIQMDALSSNLSEAYQQKAEASKTYAVAIRERADSLAIMDKNLAAGNLTQQEYDLRLEELNDNVEKSKRLYDDAADGVSRLETEMGDSAKAASDAADAYDDWGNKAGDVFANLLAASGASLPQLKDDLRSLGADTEKLGTLSQEELTELAQNYDGTSESIVGSLQKFGVSMDEAAVQASYNTKSIRDSISSMNLDSAFANSGIAVGDFSKKLADAGVSAEDLNKIGSENLSALAASCEGNMDAMVFFIQHYNDTPLLDKDGNVQVDQAQLIDAQGNVYTWNGTELLNKDGIAVVDDIDLLDAQGNKMTWNGTDLKRKDAKATINHNINESIQAARNWNVQPLNSKTASATVTTINKVVNQVTNGNAAGGFRLHADGGIRMHANGAIATKAVPLDIVGEDGAEAIVPLTNRKYALPFVRMIAEEVAKIREQPTSTQNYYLDGRALAADAQTRKALEAIGRQIKRRSRMRG